MAERFDLAIVGAGCAGLSLAVKLVESGQYPGRIVLLDSRRQYERDRTWCTWSGAQHRFQSCVSHRWNRWTVRDAESEVEHASDRVAYEHIPADAFYREALAILGAHAGVELRLDQTVAAVREMGDTVGVECDSGPIVAPLVVDTRPASRAPSGTLLQHFGGWHVETNDAAFDPSRVTLMDFDVEQTQGPHFFYVLPFSRREALVEATFLTPRPLSRDEYARRIRSYVRRRHDSSIARVVWKEYGAIPLVSRRSRARGPARVLRVGAGAGASKPSTGYAFTSIQRTTDVLAQALCAGEIPVVPASRGGVQEWMDAVFLRFLVRHPLRAPEVFANLFRTVGPESLARFLVDEGRRSDLLRIVSAMPKLPFLRAAIGSLGR